MFAQKAFAVLTILASCAVPLAGYAAQALANDPTPAPQAPYASEAPAPIDLSALLTEGDLDAPSDEVTYMSETVITVPAAAPAHTPHVQVMVEHCTTTALLSDETATVRRCEWRAR